jgi:hypothetical protein
MTLGAAELCVTREFTLVAARPIVALNNDMLTAFELLNFQYNVTSFAQSCR